MANKEEKEFERDEEREEFEDEGLEEDVEEAEVEIDTDKFRRFLGDGEGGEIVEIAPGADRVLESGQTQNLEGSVQGVSISGGDDEENEGVNYKAVDRGYQGVGGGENRQEYVAGSSAGEDIIPNFNVRFQSGAELESRRDFSVVSHGGGVGRVSHRGDAGEVQSGRDDNLNSTANYEAGVNLENRREEEFEGEKRKYRI